MIWDRTVETIARAFHEASGAKWKETAEDLQSETISTVEDAIASNPEMFSAIAKACFDHAQDQDDAKHQARITQILEPIIGTLC